MPNISKFKIDGVYYNVGRGDVKIVSTFLNVTGSEDVVYILNQDCTVDSVKYVKGVYVYDTNNSTFVLKYAFNEFEVRNTLDSYTGSANTLYVLTNDDLTGAIPFYKGVYEWDSSIDAFVSKYEFREWVIVTDFNGVVGNPNNLYLVVTEHEFNNKLYPRGTYTWTQANGFELQSEYKNWESVTTFDGVTGQEYTLYLLTVDCEVSGTKYVKGFYTYDSANDAFILQVRAASGVFEVVTTFDGITPSADKLYILTQDCEVANIPYKAGLYEWTTDSGFIFKYEFAQVFIDVEELPTTGITAKSIYRLHTIDLTYNTNPVDSYICYGKGPNRTVPVTISDERIGIDGTFYYYSTMTDAQVNNWVALGYLAQTTFSDPDDFFVRAEVEGNVMYDFKADFTKKDLYKIYYNPTEVAGKFIEIGKGSEITAAYEILNTFDGVLGETDKLYILTADCTVSGVDYKAGLYEWNLNNGFVLKYEFVKVFSDYDTLPNTDISNNTVYRVRETYYKYDNNTISQPASFKATGAQITTTSTHLVFNNGTSTNQTPGNEVTDALINGYVSSGLLEQLGNTEQDFENADLYKLGSDFYVNKDKVQFVEIYHLYHNPTSTADKYFEIGVDRDLEITGEDVKPGYLVNDIGQNDFFYGFKYNDEEVYTKSTNNGTVTVYNIVDKDIIELGQGQLLDGILTYDSKSYSRYSSIDDYYIDESDIKFINVDLALKLYKLIKSSYKEVSTFVGETGDTDVLYYLNTKYDTYRVGFYKYDLVNGFELILEDNGIEYVSTFDSVVGNPVKLYYLDTEYDDYKVGFYRYIKEETGGVVTRDEFVLISEDKVFIDVDTLPTTDINTNMIYRLKVYKYTYENEEIPKPYGYKSNDPTIIITTDGIENTGTLLPGNLVSDNMLNNHISSGRITFVPNFEDAEFFSVGTNKYVHSSEITRTLLYELYHNPDGDPANYILIDDSRVSKLNTQGLHVYSHDGATQNEMEVVTEIGVSDQSEPNHATDDRVATELAIRKAIDEVEAIIDVEVLPTSDIKRNVIYRRPVYQYRYGSTQFDSEPIRYRSLDQSIVNPGQYGVSVNDPAVGYPISTPWSGITQATVDGWIANGGVEGPLEYDRDGFMYIPSIDKGSSWVDVNRIIIDYKLFHNPTSDENNYILINGDVPEGAAFTDVATLPTTDIDDKTIYRIEDYKYVYDNGIIQNPIGYASLDANNLYTTSTGINWKDGSTTITTWWEEVTDTLISSFISNNLLETVSNLDDSQFFKVDDNFYVISTLVSKEHVYRLYHNPTKTVNGWIEINSDQTEHTWLDKITSEKVNGKVQANAVLIVNGLPSVNIKEKSFYQIVENVAWDEHQYLYNSTPVENFVTYKIVQGPGALVAASETDGLYYANTGSYTAWNDVDEAFVQSLINVNQIEVCDFSDPDKQFSGFTVGGQRKFDYYTKFTDVTTPHSFGMTKLFRHENGAWVSHSTIRLTANQYSHLSSDQQNDGTIYIVNENHNSLIDFDYKTLSNRPSINNVELVDDKSWDDLGLPKPIIDVDELPISDIEQNYVYRLTENTYKYGPNEDVLNNVVGYVFTSAYYSADDTGIHFSRSGYPSQDWAGTSVADSLINGGINVSQILETTTTFEDAQFFKIDTNAYDYKDTVTKEVEITLYHNVDGTVNGYIKIGGSDILTDDVTIETVDGKLQANAILAVNELPLTNIKENSLYEVNETVTVDSETFTMTKLFRRVNSAWKSYSTVKIPEKFYNGLTAAQKNDGTIYIVDAIAIIDVEELPTTNILKDAVYRLKQYKKYEFTSHLEIAQEDTFVSTDTTNCTINNSGISAVINGLTEVYLWADVTDAFITTLKDNGLIEQMPLSRGDLANAGYKKSDGKYYNMGNDYVYVQNEYLLYHNPTAGSNAWILINPESLEVDNLTTENIRKKIQANALIAVTDLPTSDIKLKSLYRISETKYKDLVRNSYFTTAQGYASKEAAVTMSSTGLTVDGVTTSWENVTDTQVDNLVNLLRIELVNNLEYAKFVKFANDTYQFIDSVEETKAGLYYNIDGTLQGWRFITEVDPGFDLDNLTTTQVNGKIRSNAILDVATLPTSDIKINSIYRIDLNGYWYNGNKLSETPLMYKCNPDSYVADPVGLRYVILTDPDPWINWTDERIQDTVDHSHAYITTDFDEAEFFRVGENTYVYKDDVTKMEGYELYHNPTGLVSDGTLLGSGKASNIDEVTIIDNNGLLQANAIINVTELPTTDIKTNSIYRFDGDVYYYNRNLIQEPTGYAVTASGTSNGWSVTPNGLYGTEVGYDHDTLIHGTDNSDIEHWIGQGYFATVTEFEDATFFKTGSTYDYCTKFTKEHKLACMHNPTGLENGGIELGLSTTPDDLTIVFKNSKLKSNAIIEVTELPTTDIQDRTLYGVPQDKYVAGGQNYSTAVGFKSRDENVVVGSSGLTVDGELTAGNNVNISSLVESLQTAERLRAAVPYNYCDFMMLSGDSTVFLPKASITYSKKGLYFNLDGVAGNGIPVYDGRSKDEVDYVYNTLSTDLQADSDRLNEVERVTSIALNELHDSIVSGGIIDVKTLPVDDIKTNAFYRLKQKVTYTDTVIKNSGVEINPKYIDVYVAASGHTLEVGINGISIDRSSYTAYWNALTDDVVSGLTQIQHAGRLTEKDTIDTTSTDRFYRYNNGLYDRPSDFSVDDVSKSMTMTKFFAYDGNKWTNHSVISLSAYQYAGLNEAQLTDDTIYIVDDSL